MSIVHSPNATVIVWQQVYSGMVKHIVPFWPQQYVLMQQWYSWKLIGFCGEAFTPPWILIDIIFLCCSMLQMMKNKKDYTVLPG